MADIAVSAGHSQGLYEYRIGTWNGLVSSMLDDKTYFQVKKACKKRAIDEYSMSVVLITMIDATVVVCALEHILSMLSNRRLIDRRSRNQRVQP